jgi:predicted enzyme related to lactoylglutathione lyase
MMRSNVNWVVIFFLLYFVMPYGTAAQKLTGDTDTPPLFTSSPTILLRSPDPLKLAEFYLALGMKEARRHEFGVYIYLEGNHGSLEILMMDSNTQPGGPKTTRTQQGVVTIFETTDQAEVVRRAKLAGSPLIERWNSSERGHSIYYIADPENNIFGFAPRYHNPNIDVP